MFILAEDPLELSNKVVSLLGEKLVCVGIHLHPANKAQTWFLAK